MPPVFGQFRRRGQDFRRLCRIRAAREAVERSQHRVSVSYLRSHAPQQHTEATDIEESGFA
jgi:hypothetical protein